VTQPGENDADASAGATLVTTVSVDVAELARHIAFLVAEHLSQTVGQTAATWVDVKGAALHLNCSAERVRKLVQRGAIPFHQERRGGRIFFNRRELDQWLLAQ
jgi:excisionase family DNA binding protein